MQTEGELGDPAEIGYPDRFHPVTAPFSIALAAALRGVGTPVSGDGRFHFCDLGCGAGLGTCVFGEANPEADFVGIDLLPHHIERAEKRARDAGLQNTRFLCADVRSHRDLSLPEFDLVVLHGVYTWVEPEVRRAIVDFLGSRLRPGGLALVSYNALPGWGGLGTVREWVRSRAGRIGGEPARAVWRAVEELTSLLACGAPLLSENPGAARLLGKLRASHPSYLAHELLTPFGEPASFRDVASEMARGGLSYVGSADPSESLPRCSLPAGCRDAIEEERDPVERETLRDIVVNRFFRFDLYRRPGPSPAGDPLEGILFGLHRPASEVPNVIPAIDGEISIDGDWFEPLKSVLAAAAVTRATLLATPALQGHRKEEIVEGLRLLHAGGHAWAFRVRGDPPIEAPPHRIRIPSGLNRRQLDHLGEEGAGATLASRVSGTGHWFDLPEAIALSALTREEPEAWFAGEAKRQGLSLTGEGGADPLAPVGDLLRGFRTGLLPTLIRLGLAEALP